MRKIFVAAAIIAALPFLTGCSKEVDYTQYISEKRTEIFMYADDDKEITVYCSEREQPYSSDGYCGEKCEIVEIYASFLHNPESVALSVGKYSGEMNYKSVENKYYLSFTASAFTGSSLDVTLTYGGKSDTYTALGARTDGVLSCEEALKCVIEYDRQLFEGMTVNGVFNGEISVRLLYDDGCYYYVGVCNREKKINAYLLDGERGKIIATKQLQS